MRVCAQSSQRSTWPPSAAVRQSSIARHDAPLREAEVTLVGGAPGGPEAAEDVRHLQRRSGHAAGSGRRWPSQVEQLERALDLADGAERDPGVARGRGDLPVAQAGPGSPGCRRPCSSRWVAKQCRRVCDGHRLVEPGGLDRLAAGALHRAGRDRPGRVRPREQPGPRAGAAPVGAQDREQLRREHDVAVAPALALADADRHPGAVDVGRPRARPPRRRAGRRRRPWSAAPASRGRRRRPAGGRPRPGRGWPGAGRPCAAAGCGPPARAGRG